MVERPSKRSAILSGAQFAQCEIQHEMFKPLRAASLGYRLLARRAQARPADAGAALKVSRQIEELDRRGDTFSGVPLVGKLSYRDIAVTADMGSTLPWLRAEVHLLDERLPGPLETCSRLRSRGLVGQLLRPDAGEALRAGHPSPVGAAPFGPTRGRVEPRSSGEAHVETGRWRSNGSSSSGASPADFRERSVLRLSRRVTRGVHP